MKLILMFFLLTSCSSINLSKNKKICSNDQVLNMDIESECEFPENFLSNF